MTQAASKQDLLLAFLIDNMREMETELRAHSIVLEAIALGVVPVEEMEHALTLARGSEAMLNFVRGKYASIDELCSAPMTRDVANDAGMWLERWQFPKLPN